TQKAGLRPDSIGYAAKETPGADSIRLTFKVTARYADLRRLLAAFESNARFLVVDTVAIGSTEADGETLDTSLHVVHFFRDAGMRPLHRRTELGSEGERTSGAAGAVPRAASAAPSPAPAKKAPPKAVPAPRVKVREAGGER